MTSLSNNRTLRDTVSAVLLVWVLALGAGWADACLVQPHRADFSRTTDSGDGAGSPARVPNLAAGRGVLVAGHDEAGHASTASCPGAFDAGTQGLVEATSRSDPTDPGSAPLSAPVWTKVAPIVPTTVSASAVATAPAGPPLRIRYSRLAL